MFRKVRGKGDLLLANCDFQMSHGHKGKKEIMFYGGMNFTHPTRWGLLYINFLDLLRFKYKFSLEMVGLELIIDHLFYAVFHLVFLEKQ